MKNLSVKSTFFLLLVLWFVMNLLQSIFTGIHNDEVYYALWGKHLAWGYFDHPPMIALFNYLSSLLFSGNLSIRFLSVVSQVAVLFVTWQLIADRSANRKDIYLFFIVAASLVMFSTMGFLTTPDTPLLLFSALFLWAYKQFLQKESWSNSGLLTIAMTGLIYSKYQGGLLIGFIILSNLKLLLKPKFWLAGIAALALLSPHFYWQYTNHFPSLQFHLVDRSDMFQIFYMLEYLPNQLFVFNPFTFGLLVYVLIKYRSQELFERGLYFVIIGFISFFWIMTVRGHAEPHWTLAASLPIIIVLYNKAKQNEAIRKFIFRFVFGSLAILFALRIILLLNLPLARNAGFDDGTESRAIKSIAGNKPLVFNGSFQMPSLYQFYYGIEATTFSTLYNRRTQFDIWQKEIALQNKSVFICADVPMAQKYSAEGIEITGRLVDSFHVSSRLKITIDIAHQSVLHVGDTVETHYSLYNPYPFAVNFKDKNFPTGFSLCFLARDQEFIFDQRLDRNLNSIQSHQTIEGTLRFVVPELLNDQYSLCVTTQTIFGPAFENPFIPVEVTHKK